MAGSYLQDRFTKAIPKEFLTRLLERQQSIYHQSISAAFAESWTNAEALNTLPYIRRGFWENEFRKAANECGLRAFDTPHAGENCSCVLVKALSSPPITSMVRGNLFVRRNLASRTLA